MSATVVSSDNIVSQSDDKWKGIANNDITREKYEKRRRIITIFQYLSH